MKKVFLFAALLLMCGTAGAFAAPPVLFYSDLTSGPGTGGKDDKGLFVTIVGRNFGATQGAGSVSVGGGTAAAYPVWSDTKVTFQLGPEARTGDIVLTTSGGSSNGIHFTVRPGRIFFVSAASPNSPGSGTFADPWRSPASFFAAQQPGDTCYVRAGTYSGQYGNASRPYNVSYYNSTSGAADNEIAWVGYPGETALFRADDNTVYNGAFEFISNNQYIVVAGLSLYGRGDGREQVRLYSDNCRLVNNKIEGIKTLSYAMIGITASHLKIWGNECFGATSGNKLDHIFYFQGPGDDVDIGWNYVHDNDIAVGPLFSWNMGGTSTNIRIHDNLLDCRNSSDIIRLAGIWAGSGGSIWFTNNLVIGAGGSLNNDNAYHAIYNYFAQAYVYHNTFYLSQGAGSNSVLNAYGTGSIDAKNNIFYNRSSIGYASGNVTLDSNCYFGGAGSVPSGDAHAVAADPLFANAGALDLHLAAASPVIGKGADLASLVPRDYDGVSRAGVKADMGAFQYTAGLSAVPPGTGAGTGSGGTTAAGASLSGTVTGRTGAPLSGVTVTLSGGAVGTAVTDASGAYRFTGLPANVTCSLTPSKTGYLFTPASQQVGTLSAGVSGRDFTALQSLSIRGQVKDATGAPLPGAKLSLSGDRSGTAVTDAGGLYEFTGIPEGSRCAVTSSNESGLSFDPATRSADALAASVTGWDFSAVAVTAARPAGQLTVVGSLEGRGAVNPAKGESARIYFKGSAAGRFECRVLTLTGELVWETSMDNVQEGNFEWRVPRSQASGIYLVRVSGPGVSAAKKIAVLQ